MSSLILSLALLTQYPPGVVVIHLPAPPSAVLVVVDPPAVQPRRRAPARKRHARPARTTRTPFASCWR